MAGSFLRILSVVCLLFGVMRGGFTCAADENSWMFYFTEASTFADSGMPTSISSIHKSEKEYKLTGNDGVQRVITGERVYWSSKVLNFVASDGAEAYLILPEFDKPLLRLTLNVPSTPGKNFNLTDADSGELLYTFKTNANAYTPETAEPVGRRYKISLQAGTTQGSVSSMGITLDTAAPVAQVSLPWVNVDLVKLEQMQAVAVGSVLQIGCDTDGALLDYSLSRAGEVITAETDVVAPASVVLGQSGEYMLTVAAHKEGMSASEPLELQFSVSDEAKANPEIGFEKAEISAALDNIADFFAPMLLNPHEVSPISYVSSAPDVATVDSEGFITLLSAGRATVTAIFEGNDMYAPSSPTYALTVYNYTASAADILINGQRLSQSADATYPLDAHLTFQSEDANAEISYSISRDAEPYAAGIYDGLPLTLTESGEYLVTAINTNPEGMPCDSREWRFSIADEVDAYAGTISFDFKANDYGMTRYDNTNSAFNPDTTEITSATIPELRLTLSNLPSPYYDDLPSRNRLWQDSWRLYIGAYTLHLSMPAHTEMTSIEFAGSLFTADADNVLISADGYRAGHWTGNAGEISMSIETPFRTANLPYADIDALTVNYTVHQPEPAVALCGNSEPVGHNQVAPRGDISFALPEDAALYICFEPLNPTLNAATSETATADAETQTIEIDDKTYSHYPYSLYQANAKGTLHYAAVRYGRPSEVRTLYIDTLTGLSAPETTPETATPRYYDLQGRPLAAPVPGQPYLSTSGRAASLLR